MPQIAASTTPQQRIESWSKMGDNASAHFDLKSQVYSENNKPYGTISGLFSGKISLFAYFCPKQAAAADKQAALAQAKSDIKAAYPKLANKADTLIAQHIDQNTTSATGSVLKGLKATFEREQKAYDAPLATGTRKAVGLFSKAVTTADKAADRVIDGLDTTGDTAALTAKMEEMRGDPAPESFNASKEEINSALDEIRNALRDVKESYTKPASVTNFLSTATGTSTPETKLASRMQNGYKVAGATGRKQLSPLAKCIIRETQKTNQQGWIGTSLGKIEEGKGAKTDVEKERAGKSFESAMNNERILARNEAVITTVAGDATEAKGVIASMKTDIQTAKAKQEKVWKQDFTRIQSNQNKRSGKTGGIFSGFFSGGTSDS